MAKAQRYWTLVVHPFQRIIPGLVFTSKKEATARAREENRYGEWRGRGVVTYPCDAGGHLIARPEATDA
jgi:hypothetical protein